MTLMAAVLTALTTGVITSISPCPLTTNIAAVSFISRKAGHPRQAALSGIIYTLGRTVAYALIGAIILKGVAEVSELSVPLQNVMNKLLGPALVVSGMFILQLLSFSLGKGRLSQWAQDQAHKRGPIVSAFLLGFVFALAFCPTSAALFFGSLIVVAKQADSWLLLPTIYGVGTALPVLFFSALIILAAEKVGRVFENIKVIELWTRRVTGLVFIIAGLYYCFIFNF